MNIELTIQTREFQLSPLSGTKEHIQFDEPLYSTTPRPKNTDYSPLPNIFNSHRSSLKNRKTSADLTPDLAPI